MLESPGLDGAKEVGVCKALVWVILLMGLELGERSLTDECSG